MISIFCMLHFLSVMLNTVAWIIIIIRLSPMKLRVPICDSHDCPIVLNMNLIYGICVASVGALSVCLALHTFITYTNTINLQFLLSGIFMFSFVEYRRFLEAQSRRQRQYSLARKRGIIQSTPQSTLITAMADTNTFI